MMKRPLIGITAGLFTVETGVFAGMERVYVNRDYVDAIEKAGGVPLLLPPVEDEEAAAYFAGLCAGFLFSGGIDVNPVLYGHEPHAALGAVNTRWDRAELSLLRRVLDTDKPVLAVCRGHQLLNVACGGTLYQDLSEMPQPVFRHSQLACRADRIHTVGIVPDSVLGEIFGGDLFVNSFHHQTLRDLGKGLRATACSEDGVIEAVEMEGKAFVVGVQWHPEMLLTGSDDMLPLFERFVQTAGE
ncbi:MAG: gamma-glutamyl-gamma-aminobutyrate hydrolase family protein [Oscillibacter sp.]|nr:gamma-glutamyl-gamma-aminobutyrate hydrolase family protein [Oscillibacter sp.]